MSNPTTRQQEIEAYQSAYSASSFEEMQARYRKRLLLELLEQRQPKRILEVGCGWDTIANAWQGFEHLCIVEPGSKFAEKAKNDVAHNSNVKVVREFLENAIDVLKDNYDLILLSSLLHEVPDAEALLLSARALCSDHTLIHVNVPNAKSLHRLLALEMGLINSLCVPSGLQKTFKQPRIFDLQSLKALAVLTGFDVMSEGSFFVKPFSHAQMHTLMQTGFATQAMLDGLWSLTKHFPEHGSEIYINLQRKEFLP
ncbi:class I SAM-dependent methyltransferase [Nitrosomonas mobilis]|uniref:Methyltransferase domain protein n=1 Tax=Nitrosomonas mobilis TaxID=51642 RepID=A0A1G5SJ14_9PROT|nr:methyltransferase domain-containing protein [Nitrosomonas mobilis]SCZ87082.1 Methyltransferase domain protein [Nitrosomonas mobilis]